MPDNRSIAQTRLDAGSERRVTSIDAARGAALLAMIVFHFFRDLEMFSILPPGTTVTGGWAVSARLIAGTFMLLVGVSLVLAHGKGLRLSSFLRRATVLGLSALAVSAATYAAIPDRLIYFGILHSILVASIVGLPFARLPPVASLAAASLVLIIWHVLGKSLLIDPWFGWTGLAAFPRPALDLIPVVPWLAVTLVGVATAKMIVIRDLPGLNSRVGDALAWLGRHSLAVYLLHQPLMIGAIWLLLRTW